MGFFRDGKFVEERFTPDDSHSRYKAALDVSFEVGRVRSGKTTAIKAMRRLMRDHRILRKDKRRGEKAHMLSELVELFVAETLATP